MVGSSQPLGGFIVGYRIRTSRWLGVGELVISVHKEIPRFRNSPREAGTSFMLELVACVGKTLSQHQVTYKILVVIERSFEHLNNTLIECHRQSRSQGLEGTDGNGNLCSRLQFLWIGATNRARFPQQLFFKSGIRTGPVRY